MKYRCNTATAPAYKNYGGRGIRVCDEWCNSYTAFKLWALESGYKDNLTIDRIDNDAGYTPDNCCWITKAENTAKANRSVVRRKANRGEYFGVSPQGVLHIFDNASEFARQHSLSPNAVRYFANQGSGLHHGWYFGFTNT